MSSMGKTLAITSSLSSILPLNHHPPLPLIEAAKAVRQHAARLRAWIYGAFELQPETEKRIPTNQDLTDCLPKLFEQSILAVLVNGIIKKSW